MIDIEEAALGAFKQNVFASFEFLMKQSDGVGEMWFEKLTMLVKFISKLCSIKLNRIMIEGTQQLVFEINNRIKTLF